MEIAQALQLHKLSFKFQLLLLEAVTVQETA